MGKRSSNRNKRNKRDKRDKREIIYRTKEERQAEVTELISQLSEFELGMHYKPIQRLYKLFKEYIQEDKRIVVNIPFPEINRRIKGLLAISIREKVSLVLQYEQ